MIARFLAGFKEFLLALANWPGGPLPSAPTASHVRDYTYDQTSDDEGAVVAMLAVVCAGY